jgi:uncharacterized protein YfcZ (UPF0381/DUF406 family)
MTTEDNVVSTPAEEVNQPEETVTPAQEGTQVSEPQEETIGSVLQEKREPDAIPKARLDKEIARRKEAERALAELQQKATTQSMTREEINTDLRALADEHGIDAGFLNKLATAIKAQAEAQIEEKLRPLTERERQQKIDAAFNVGFSKAMDNLPEYKDVVNPSVIKTLSLDPSNANKTFRQLIEETYGNALAGKRTIERATPRGGATSGDLDFRRARTDSAYFREVMADPTLKKQYNDRLIAEG